MILQSIPLRCGALLSNPFEIALLAAVLLLSTCWPQTAAAEEGMIQYQAFDISITELLDQNGQLVLPKGASGSIDPAGFEMVSDLSGAPRFVRSAQSLNDRWSEGEFGIRGCSGSVGAVEALATIDGYLYIGGSFLGCGSTAASNVVRYDPATGEFSPLGDGVSNEVRAMAVIGPDLYVGGFFGRAGGAPARYVARYDTTRPGNEGWSALGDGVGSIVFALTTIGTDLYVGGQFSQAGDVPAGLVARYDTTKDGNAGWSSLGDGLDGFFVGALTAVGSRLFVGGRFTHAGGQPASHIAEYDTTQSGNGGWSALGDGVNSIVRALTAVGTDVYVGGEFFAAGGGPARRIARYDATQSGNAGWSDLGDWLNARVFALVAVGTNLYVGGELSGGVAIFDTTQQGNAGWSLLGGGVNNAVDALVPIGTDLYVGGFFSKAGGTPVKNIARFDTSRSDEAGWSILGNGMSSEVNALASIDRDLYVAGNFGEVGALSASRIARYDTTRPGDGGWSVLGDGVNGVVNAMAAVGTVLYVGGEFTLAGDAPASHIAYYDTAQSDNSGWRTLGDGVDGTVNALVVVGTDLYVGGSFSMVGGVPASRIARYDTTQSGNGGWSPLGDGVNGTVRALAAIGTDLYVGGQFWQAGGGSASRIARYDTLQTGNAGWAVLGDGVNSTVLALTSIDTDLYVGGQFNQAGGKPANHIARFNTTQSSNTGWSALGGGVNGAVRTLVAVGTRLYIGGGFTQVGDNWDRGIVSYDTTQLGDAGWAAMGSGLNGFFISGGAFALEPVGPRLYVAGDFDIAGQKLNGNLAHYDFDRLLSDRFEQE